MLVPEFSYYIDIGFWYLKLLVVLSFPVIGYVIRQKWEFAVAKEVEIRRLMCLAAEEAARAEQEAEEVGYYADVNVNRAAFVLGDEGKVKAGSFGYCPEVAVQGECAKVGLSNVKAHHCAVCLSPTTTRCSRCKSVPYCSTKCQVFHWRIGHRDKCHPPSMLCQSSNAEGYHHSKTSIEENKVTLIESVEIEDRHLNLSSTHLEGNVFSGGQIKRLNGKNDNISPKTLKEVKPSISAASLSTAFSSDSSLSSATSYSSDDASTTESSASSDLENFNGCQHDDTSNQATSVAQLANEIKPCDPNGTVTAPSRLRTQLISTLHGSQKTSHNTSNLSAESCDPLVAKSGPSDVWEGALDCRWSESVKTKSHANNDYLSNIGSSFSRTSGLYGKIDKSCHVNGKMHASFSGINEPSDESVSSKKIDLSSSEAGIPVLLSSNLLKHAKDVDNSVSNISRDYKSKYSSSATFFSPPGGESQDDVHKVTISPLSSIKKADRSINGTNHISNHTCSSASNGDETVHSVKGDNSCQANDVSHSQSAKCSSLFAEKLGRALNSSECIKQSSKSKLVRSLPSSSHGTHSFIDSGRKVASRVTNVNVKSISNDVTSNKSYSHKVANGLKVSTWKAVDHFQASKLSRHYGADERDVKKVVFSYELFKSLYGWNKIVLQPCGLVNCGNSCYANVVLQCLTFTPPLTAYLLEGLHSRSCTERDWCFTCEFEKLILKEKDGKSPISPTGIISQIHNIGSHLSNGREEDAHEFLRYVVDTMQSICMKEAVSKISGNVEEETTLLSLTFGGYLQSKIRCMKCGNKSKRSERMMDLSVEIEGSIGSLDDALKRFTSTETLDAENKYNCDRCKSYQKARKKLTILEAPNILTVALKRFQAGQFGKLSKWIDFPQILNLAPYMSGTSGDKAPVYDLYGVIVHLDTMNAAFSGHYVCYVKNIRKKWFKIDDSVVKTVEFGEVKKQSAYMLLYARCSPRAPRYLREKLISDSKPKATSPLTRHSPVTPRPESPVFDNSTSSEA